MTELMITPSRILRKDSCLKVTESAILHVKGWQERKNFLSCLFTFTCDKIVPIKLNFAYFSEAPVRFPAISVPSFRYINATSPTEPIANKIKELLERNCFVTVYIDVINRNSATTITVGKIWWSISRKNSWCICWDRYKWRSWTFLVTDKNSLSLTGSSN